MPSVPPVRADKSSASRRSSAAAAAALIAASLIGTTCAAVAANPSEPQREAICRLVDGAAAANRLPAGFLARILWQESRFRSETTSPAGAEGVAQFLPRTAADRGLIDPRDPAPAIVAAARLLADFKLQFGNLGLAAAAYNAGASRVVKWLRRQSDLPGETRLYVVAVTGRPAEEWGDPGGGRQLSGVGAEPCLALMADPAGPAPARPAAPSWLLELDRNLARSIDFHTNPWARHRSVEPGSLRAAEALCGTLRSLGARCAIYQP